MEKAETHQFPEDLIFNVLAWLPAKSLMRFKTVCKSWQALILDPYFVESHHTISRPRRPDSSYLVFLMATAQQGVVYHSVSSFNGKPQWGIFPAKPDGVFSNQLPLHTFKAANDGYDGYGMRCTNIVNGLICIWVSPFQFELLNLTTREKVALPRLETPNYRHARDFYPSYYLGFDPSKKQYKVLFRGETGQYFIITFSNSTCMSWKKVESKPQCGLLAVANTCVDGAIYWNVKDSRAVQYFEVGEEKFKVLHIPDRAGEDDEVHQTEIGGKFTLAFFTRCYIGSGTFGSDQITLWRLINRNEGVWVKSLVELASSLIDGQYLRFCGSTNTGNMLLRTSEPSPGNPQHTRYKLIFCDLGEKKKHETVQLIFEDNFPLWKPISVVKCVSITHHVENILPLNLQKRMTKEPRIQRSTFYNGLSRVLGSKVFNWLSTAL
ncbi:OLC1v1016221C1 [Oldenlandia corymbosa var. corymbosa]|uniref:OLC1v1016221C1 n=1 Tax=Oldenlandia corymbosa var. corymbosa TaxID=529605 RepID=A0AAV1E580_OLDCO|nr:OLC1v1016221C1 [Oldenlandia corymbosa var. corymbosa]